MKRPLMVGVAHGLDLLTFLLAIGAGVSIDGEWNVLARDLVALGAVGLGLLIVLKGAAAMALACIVAWKRYPWVARLAFVPAVGAGIIGAVVNLVTYTQFA